ncbi:uncharacterized protein LOC110987793 isoform X2 [Acanthaster planci]|uniref:Uncharacterized protein LOC110987793 isoform X2 n=1 Tax=Acanthaster planci TaxID=133434 RepID=A0A8B7ZND2_ACAPL|nr:uncharacterized protein LOC110987793 isoform X2 [Acanthaster planci]
MMWKVTGRIGIDENGNRSDEPRCLSACVSCKQDNQTTCKVKVQANVKPTICSEFTVSMCSHDTRRRLNVCVNSISESSKMGRPLCGFVSLEAMNECVASVERCALCRTNLLCANSSVMNASQNNELLTCYQPILKKNLSESTCPVFDQHSCDCSNSQSEATSPGEITNSTATPMVDGHPMTSDSVSMLAPTISTFSRSDRSTQSTTISTIQQRSTTPMNASAEVMNAKTTHNVGSTAATTGIPDSLPVTTVLIIGALVIAVGIFVMACTILVVVCRRRMQERPLHRGINWEDEGYMGVSERGSPVHKSKVKSHTRGAVFTNQTYEEEIAIGIRGLSHDGRSFVPVTPPPPAPIRKTEDGYVEYNSKRENVTINLGAAGGNKLRREDLPLPRVCEDDDYVEPYEELSEVDGAGARIGASWDVKVTSIIPDKSQDESTRDYMDVDKLTRVSPIPPSSFCGKSPGEYVDVDRPGTALQLNSNSQIPPADNLGLAPSILVPGNLAEAEDVKSLSDCLDTDTPKTGIPSTPLPPEIGSSFSEQFPGGSSGDIDHKVVNDIQDELRSTPQTTADVHVDFPSFPTVVDSEGPVMGCPADFAGVDCELKAFEQRLSVGDQILSVEPQTDLQSDESPFYFTLEPPTSESSAVEDCL